ncbi:RNaseH domain-containing protein [Azospirillum sp. Sh1]|uniref:RNaseH domain-containing protein n=1 Tax=Azospirillum sp. Sh1 TaxID=2607285 RepID=UPI0011EF1620|nr:RNaseH domain-containing protein [Azospirillum sp. Sh1]KAA0578210.1 DUF3893 domain-containing protein [Azospirillum sp. Sh1]
MTDRESYEIADGDEAPSGAPRGTYVALGSARRTRLVPLAFTIPDAIAPVSVAGFAVSWTAEALAAFRALREDVRDSGPDFARTLPYASLRGLMELRIHAATRIEPGMGLETRSLDSFEKAELRAPFLYVEGGGAEDVRTAARPVLDRWIVDFLIPGYAAPGGAGVATVDRVRELFERDRLLDIAPFRSQILPWRWSSATGTTQPVDAHSFRALADRVARLIAGREVFPGLGPMKRIIAARGSGSGMAELVTEPIRLENRGPFSLTLRLEVVTFPALHQPLLTLSVSKRRWISALADSTYDQRAIGGLVFSDDHPDRAFGYSVNRRRDEDGVWRWRPDNAFEALRGDLGLPFVRLDGAAIVRGEASTDRRRVLLTYREGLQDSRRRHGIRAGVPERDKLDAFDAVAEIVRPLGVLPFDGYEAVKAPHAADDAASRMINAPTLLGAAIEALEEAGGENPTPAYFARLSDSEIDDLLARHIKRGLAEIQNGLRIIRHRDQRGGAVSDQAPELGELVAANRRAVERLYPDSKPLLVIFHENGAEADLRLLQAVVRVLWGGALDIIAHRMPDGTHGPRSGLPGKDLKVRERAALRVDSWRPVAQAIAGLDRQTFCLIMARRFYQDPAGGNSPRLDDKVNKPAARQSLASLAGACVQYILPPSASRESGAIDLGNFLHRAQAAMKDLISAHSGRVDGVAATVAKRLGGRGEAAPREIIGITIVRRNAGRSRQGVGKTFLPIAVRLDVASGRCDMRFAHEGGAGRVDSGWKFFPRALADVSRVSPVRLGETLADCKTRFMRFVETVVTESVEDGAQPLVIVDSSNCARLWGWLTDPKINPAAIEIGERQLMQENWKGARIVRIRQDLAPGIVEDKEQRLAESAPDDARPTKALQADLVLRTPTSPPGLYRLRTAGRNGCVPYLSIGRKTLHQNKRGPSCHATTLASVPLPRPDSQSPAPTNADGSKLLGLIERPPYVNMWPTPNPLEIVVALRQDEDDPDDIARLVESLRYGFGHYSDWTTLPAPLFFERVVRDYISAFALEDAENDPDGQDAGGSEEPSLGD